MGSKRLTNFTIMIIYFHFNPNQGERIQGSLSKRKEFFHGVGWLSAQTSADIIFKTQLIQNRKKEILFMNKV
jgi:hypothetical protein